MLMLDGGVLRFELVRDAQTTGDGEAQEKEAEPGKDH